MQKTQSNSFIKVLEYDTQLFGYKVACVDLKGEKSEADFEGIVRQMREAGIRLAYVLSENKEWLSCYDFAYVSAKITYEKTLAVENSSKEKPVIDGLKIVIYNDGITDSLVDLAFQSGQYSRFRQDPNFKNGEFEKLYSDWIKKSISKEIADYVIVAFIADVPAGLVTLRLADEFSEIGLVAVDSAHHGKKIGTFLLREAEKISMLNLCRKIRVATQLINENACAFYKSNGYYQTQLIHIAHLWLD